jgi:hypothetical protein
MREANDVALKLYAASPNNGKGAVKKWITVSQLGLIPLCFQKKLTE